MFSGKWWDFDSVLMMDINTKDGSRRQMIRGNMYRGSFPATQVASEHELADSAASAILKHGACVDAHGKVHVMTTQYDAINNLTTATGMLVKEAYAHVVLETLHHLANKLGVDTETAMQIVHLSDCPDLTCALEYDFEQDPLVLNLLPNRLDGDYLGKPDVDDEVTMVDLG